MVRSDLDVIDIFMNAGLMVQLVLLLLLFFSIASWSIILIKLRYISKSYKESASFIDFFWKSRDLSNAFVKAKQMKNSPVARIFRVGYLELKKLSQSGMPLSSKSATSEASSLGTRFTGTDNLKRSLRRAINTEMTRLTQMVPFLATTGNIVIDGTSGIGIWGSGCDRGPTTSSARWPAPSTTWPRSSVSVSRK